MCTVSFFYKGNNEFILTSNRDESPERETLKPAEYTISETRMIFPKDTLGGGTWIGASEQNRVVCLLNGGFTLHKRLPKYRHSRGIVVKDFLSATDIVNTVKSYDLDRIEPFTIVIVDWNRSLELYELVWDGSQKHFRELPLQVPHIWSSSTLYTEQMKQLRRDWFLDFQEKKQLHADAFIDFHTNAGVGDSNIDVVMDREIVKTISITQVEKKEHLIAMKYQDLVRHATHEISFNPIVKLHE